MDNKGVNNQLPKQPRKQRGDKQRQSRKDRNSAQNKISRKIITDFASSYVALPYHQKKYVSNQIRPLLINGVQVNQSAVLTGHSIPSQNKNDDQQQQKQQGNSNHQNKDGGGRAYTRSSHREGKRQRAHLKQKLRRRKRAAKMQFYEQKNPNCQYGQSLEDAVSQFHKGQAEGVTPEILKQLNDVIKKANHSFRAHTEEFCSSKNQTVECDAFVQTYLQKMQVSDLSSNLEKENEEEEDEDDKEG